MENSKIMLITQIFVYICDVKQLLKKENMKTTDICKTGTKFRVKNFFNVYIYQDITTKHWNIEVYSDDWEFTLNQCDLTKREALQMALELNK